jgi:hypothetical protein
MSRYRAHEAAGLWSVFDRRTGEAVLREEGLAHACAQALAELLNCLEQQQNWRSEAELWPDAA